MQVNLLFFIIFAAVGLILMFLSLLFKSRDNKMIKQCNQKVKGKVIKYILWNSCKKATSTHYEVGSKVRKAIEDIGGTMPEDLPTPQKSIKIIEKEQLKRLKNKRTKLMLDE